MTEGPRPPSWSPRCQLWVPLQSLQAARISVPELLSMLSATGGPFPSLFCFFTSWGGCEGVGGMRAWPCWAWRGGWGGRCDLCLSDGALSAGSPAEWVGMGGIAVSISEMATLVSGGQGCGVGRCRPGYYFLLPWWLSVWGQDPMGQSVSGSMCVATCVYVLGLCAPVSTYVLVCGHPPHTCLNHWDLQEWLWCELGSPHIGTLTSAGPGPHTSAASLSCPVDAQNISTLGEEVTGGFGWKRLGPSQVLLLGSAQCLTSDLMLGPSASCPLPVCHLRGGQEAVPVSPKWGGEGEGRKALFMAHRCAGSLTPHLM